MTASQDLRTLNAENWRVATTHAFTNALTDGTLSREQMTGYLQQDCLLAESFVRRLASAVAHAPTIADAGPATQFLGLICGTENTCLERLLQALEVPEAQRATPETTAFLALMDEARPSGRFEVMIPILVVAAWVCRDWATPFEDQAEPLPVRFGEWITLHSGPGFAGVVAYLRAQLDALWDRLDDAAWAGFPAAKFPAQ
ncbi:MAG: TenA family protein [Pseudomonadota bacterium]